ncbi:MAG: tyrosine-type recombinase/integrase [Clostridiales bacterium]|nr:tyrosine-type recombinase/integrase [Clostridiales bacterium]
MGGRRSNGEGSVSYDKRRGTYRARVTIGYDLDEEKGKCKQKTKDIGSFKTKGEASRALAEYLKYPLNIQMKDMTFAQLYEKWADDYIAEHESYKYRIKAAYKYCSSIYNKKMRDISILDMKNCINKGYTTYVNGERKGQKQYASPETKTGIKYLFNHMFEYAVEARIVEHNYAREFSLDTKVFKEIQKGRKEKNPFSEEELIKLWKSVEFVPFADMIIYACYSGWRPRELLKIEIKDVDLENGFITGGMKTESGEERIVPIHSAVTDIVKKYYDDAIEIHSQYLFNDSSKKKGRSGLSYEQYAVRFNNVMNALKFERKFTPHCTRHTFISNAKARGVGMNEYILKRIVGHKIKDITENVYTHRDLSELKEEIELIKKPDLD